MLIPRPPIPLLQLSSSIRAIFDALDTDADGSLDRAELRAAFVAMVSALSPFNFFGTTPIDRL